MMKFVVLAVALTACSASRVYTHSLPFQPLAYHGLPAHPITYHSLPAFHGLPAQTIPRLHSPVAYTGGFQGQVNPHPLTYTTGALVAPAPYAIHTGVKTEVEAEPVEQHGYVIKY